METTLSIFDDRKNEIDFYFSIMVDINNNEPHIQTIDNNRFFKILKSNFILMLYNIVEACVVSGMLEIYENIKNDACTYHSAIEEIKKLWSNHKINQIYGPNSIKSTYENKVREIINDITNNNHIILTKSALDISGNLDARKIKDLCDKHRIRHSAKDVNASLSKVKKKRNDLSHGDVSFSECARDLTISDLEEIQDEVLIFLRDILAGMKNYYDNKQYLVASG